jgi:hypothetical protein
MLDPDFSTLGSIEIHQASGAYRAPSAEKNSGRALSSKYTGGLDLDRRKANKSLIKASKAEPKVRERRPWRAV